MIFTDFGAGATGDTRLLQTAAQARMAIALKTLSNPLATPTQKAEALKEFDAATKAIAYATSTTTSTATTPVTPPAPPPLNLPVSLPIVPPVTPSFFEEHATALKIGGGIALAGLVGYVVLRRRSKR